MSSRGRHSHPRQPRCTSFSKPSNSHFSHTRSGHHQLNEDVGITNATVCTTIAIALQLPLNLTTNTAASHNHRYRSSKVLILSRGNRVSLIKRDTVTQVSRDAERNQHQLTTDRRIATDPLAQVQQNTLRSPEQASSAQWAIFPALVAAATTNGRAGVR